MSDPYLTDAGVFKNLLGINDALELQAAETNLAELRIVELRKGLGPKGRFDANHLRTLHHHLFQDVYPWAGRTRGDGIEVDGQVLAALPVIAKEQTIFALSPRVNQQLDHLLEPIGEGGFAGLTRSEFVDRAAHLLGRLNTIHPFREGNGRTQQMFMNALAQSAGLQLAWDVVSRERMISVSIDSAQGQHAAMQRLLEEIIDPKLVLELRNAIGFLKAQNINWNERYVAMATPGRVYEGVVAARAKQYAIVQTLEGQVIVTPLDQIRS